MQTAPLLPLRSAIVTLRFLQDSAPAFHHQPALAAFLRFLAGSPEGFERVIRFDAPESGRIAYQPGDCYRFSLLALAGGEALLQTLLRQLAGLPRSSPRTGRRLPFRDNCELVALHDAFSGQPVAAFGELSAYGADDLEQEAELWHGHVRLVWQWLSPTRLLQDKARRGDAKGEARYCRNLADLDAGLLCSRLHDSLAELLRGRGLPPPPRPPAPPVEIAAGHLFWLDAGYTDADGEEHVMGGVSGRLELALPEPPPAGWLRQAVLGQYTGIGQRAAFGYGRYRLETPDGGFALRRAWPAQSLLARVRDEANLAEAWRHVRAKQRPRFADDEGGEDEAWAEALEPEAIDEDLPLERLRLALNRALAGDYQPPPLRGLLLPKPDGGLRPLAVPPFFDRVLQRAVAQVLAPALDLAQYRHSYGYRAGRSRQNARDAVQTAVREGHGWVCESDIEDFFDSVDRARLAVRLRSLYREDPLAGLVLAWMDCPVEYEGQTIPRPLGLPQGSPLSPVMANLLLDDFDGDMEVQGFRLIRFADDFVILCKTAAQAERARQAAADSLAEHGLRLNPAKTRIASCAEGFRYLGYLFVNDLAVDVSGHRGEIGDTPAIPPQSWLAKLQSQQSRSGFATPTATFANHRDAQNVSDGAANPVTPRQIGAMDSLGQLLCVTGEPARLGVHEGRLRVERGGQVLHESPWNHLQAVVLFGTHTLSPQTMKAALKAQVPVHFAGAVGGYLGVLWTGRPAEAGAGLWLKQANLFADPALCLVLAKEIVSARIRHLRETLRQRGLAEAADGLKPYLDGIDGADGLDALNGLEGAATRAFFQQAAALLPAEWGFAGRNRQPPRDPFNALLSFGYTLLHGYVESLLHADGLLPWLGFYHQAHGRHATLASDLMEPFRHLVERAALSALQRREFSPKDFFTAADGGCRMQAEARRAYLARLIERFNTPVAAYGEQDAATPLQHIHRQNLSLLGWLNRGEPFRAWRTR